MSKVNNKVLFSRLQIIKPFDCSSAIVLIAANE